MNAKTRNESYRQLFLGGGRLDILLWAKEESDRQFAEGRAEQRAEVEAKHGKPDACPCGCGTQEGFCDDEIQRQALEEELPF